MKRICHIAYTHYETDPRVKREAEALVAAGNAVDFLSLKEEGYASRRVAEGVHIIGLAPFRYRGNSSGAYILSYLHFFMNVCMYLMLRPLRYQVLHFHTMPDFIVFSGIIPRLFGARIIIDFHDVMHSIYESRFGAGIVISLVRLQTRLAAAFAHRIITVNTACRDIYVALGIPAQKIALVYNFPDEKLFYPRTIEENGDVFKVVCHGTVMERLGFDVLVKAVSIARVKIPALRLLIIGKGDFEAHIRAAITACGIDAITEYPEEKVQVSQVPGNIAGCHLGIVPTKIGPGTDIMLPLKLLEYIAMDIPVVTTALPAIKDLCDNKVVMYFRSGDAEDLAEKILDFYQRRDILQKDMRNAMQRFRTKYNWQTESNVLTTLYSDIVL